MLKKLLAGATALALVAAFAPGPAAAQSLVFQPGKDPSRFHWDSYYKFKKAHDLKGKTLTIFGPWRGGDQKLFESVLAYFEAATGAKVQYSSSENYEQQVVIDTQAGSPANITVLPQPGLIQDLASKGYIKPLGPKVGDWIAKNYSAGKSWVKLSTYRDKDGKEKVMAFPFKADVKSLVWYSPGNFQDAGYQVPKTFEQLQALTKKIVKDGGTPWCIGLGSGGATGWPATDWVEDILLRQQPPSVYDGWVKNTVKFTDPRIVEAIKTFGWFAKNNKFVDGGTAAVATTDFRNTQGLFSAPPKCYMLKQASFIPTFFPKGTKLGQDADFFYFPPYASKPDLGKPVEGAGTLFFITKDNPAAEAFIQFLETPIAHEVWMAQSGFLTPFKGVNMSAYANPTMKKEGQILLDATTFRFDGSDLMPGKIGAGAFWKGMVNYVGGESAKQVASDIQKSWDELKQKK